MLDEQLEEFYLKLEERDYPIYRFAINILSRSINLSTNFLNVSAKRYLELGYTIRFQCLRESRNELYKLLKEDGGNYNHEAILHTMHVNSIYIHMFGAFDNLAWVFQHEFNLLDDVSEKKNRKKIGLFEKEWLSALKQIDENFVTDIKKFKNWYDESKEFRDPSAHRLPLYCPPIIQSEKDLLKKQELLQLLENISVDDPKYMTIFREAQSQGVFKSWFCCNDDQNTQFISLIRAVFDDYEQFLKLSDLIFDWLEQKDKMKNVNRLNQNEQPNEDN